MTNKIKLFLAFLAIFALLSVFSFFDVFGGARSANMYNAISALPAPESDPDKDSLSNADESYWNTDFQNPDTDNDGTLDGEEVKLGRDPSRAGPEDELLSLNITDGIAGIAAAGLAEGSLKPDSPNYEESLASVVLSVVDDGFDSFTPTFDYSKIRTSDPTELNQTNYLKSTERIWEIFFKTFGSEIKNIESVFKSTGDSERDKERFIKFFDSKKIAFETVAANWAYLQVPENWKSEHVDFLNLILAVVEINKALAESKNDPIRATMAFVLMTNVAEKIPEVVESFKIKADNAGVVYPNLFK